MMALYIVSFLVGLVLAVRSMLTGVEKPRAESLLEPEPGTPPKVRIGVPTLGAFATVFGTLGYILERGDEFGSPFGRLLVAALAGGFAVAATLLALTFWARPALAEAVEDPRYVLQGIPARVTRPIGPGMHGEIVYAVDGRELVSPALGFEGGSHTVDEEVVIDRIEDGVAYVEAWSLVEQRI